MKMKMNTIKLQITLLALIIAAVANFATAQTTAFTYQGRFTDTTVAQPTNGTYIMTFRLFDAASDGTQIPDSSTAVISSVNVINGIFTVKLDFGSTAFNTSGARYLEIQVGTTTLMPRQEITSTPLALNAKTADALSTGCVGCITNEQINSIDGAKITGMVASATTAVTATTSGNVAGVVAIANGGTGSTTQNFVDLSANQTVGGNKSFTGILSGDGSGLRNISGANISGNTMLNPQRLAMLRWYDVNQATLSQPITVGSRPNALAFDGTFIYAANYGSGTVSRFRAATGAVEGGPIVVGTPIHSHLPSTAHSFMWQTPAVTT